jgi:antitoxin (DNA-binding transcriptional repressor) of toxin-antitoxin stability system
MQTYSVESVPAQWPLLLIKIGKGEEILLTEKEKPFARLVPAREMSALEQIRSVRGIAPGIDTNVEPPMDKSTYLARVRALRGSLRGIDTDVEAEDDPA